MQFFNPINKSNIHFSSIFNLFKNGDHVYTFEFLVPSEFTFHNTFEVGIVPITFLSFS